VEEIYKVKVATVNTIVMPAKRKRVRQQLGYTSQWKKAIVTLQQGFKIDVT
jgi:large subunit ribosomal protein L23